MTQSIEQGEGDIEMHSVKKKGGMNAYETVNTKEEDAVVAAVSAEEEDNKKKEEETSEAIASLYETFSMADSFDALLMFIGTLGAMATGVSLPVFCILFGDISDKLNSSSAFTKKVNEVCIIFGIVCGLNLLFGLLQVYCWTKAGERQSHRFRVAYVHAIVSKEIAWFDANGGNQLATKVADVCGKINDGLSRKAGDVIQYITQITSCLIVSFYFQWKLACVMLVSFPLLGAAGTYMINSITAAQNESVGQYAEAGGIASLSFSAIRTVTALNLQPHFITQYRKKLIQAMNVGLLKGLNVGLGNGMMFGVYFLIYALGFWYGAELVSSDLDGDCDGECITGGTVITVFFAMTLAAEALGQIAPPLIAFSTARVGIKEVVNTIEETKKNSTASKVSATAPPHLTGNISVQDVNFAYPTRPDVFVCSDFNLEIKAGETIALVGPSGSGKSTIINLLLRFYDPLSGKILLDNIDITTVSKETLRDQIGYVGQEPVLFHGTIAENIAFGDVSAHESGHRNIDDDLMARVIEAAKLANAYDFITSFPKQFQTDVGPSGLALSGGQKQRIAIARALIKKPSILLLDEATSALDAASEKVVQQSIDALAARQKESAGGQKTTIIIVAHRLSTIRNADKICVIEKGRIVELGRHEELIARNGRYYDLVKLQGADDLSSESNSPGKPLSEKANVTQNASGANAATDEALLSSKSAQAEEIEKQEEKKLSSRIQALILENPFLLITGCLGAAVFGGTFPCWGYIMAKSQAVMYYIDADNMQERAAFYSYLYIIIAGAAFISGIAQYYGICGIGERLSCSIRSKMYEALVRKPIGYFDHPEHAAGNLATMLAEDVRTVHKAFGEGLAKQAMAVCTLIIGLIFAFIASWKVTLVTLATFPLNIAAAAVQMQAFQGQQHEDVKSEDDGTKPPSTGENVGNQKEEQKPALNPSNIISSAFTNIRTIHALSMQDWVLDTYDELMLARSEARSKRGIIAGIGYGGSNCVLFGTFALLFWYGSTLMVDGEISYEELMIAMMSLMFGTFGIGQAMNDMGDQKQALYAARRIFKLIDDSDNVQQNATDPLSDAGTIPPSQRISNIEVKNVHFRYPTRKEVKVCENFSLEIKEGEVVALVGASGCGKSTLINLLLRFYDPDNGSIEIDGRNIKDINIKWLRSQIGFVGQEPVLFPGSIEDNVAFGIPAERPLLSLQEAIQEETVSKPQSNPCCSSTSHDIEQGIVTKTSNKVNEQVIGACKSANAYDFITSFPKQFQTDVGPSGLALSGGQKQRIAIARALIKKPSILLLDEATSALDAASEKVVQQSIDALAARQKESAGGQKTTIIIVAHRLSTIRNADKICVIEKGRIVELGRHEELLEHGGLYRSLWDKQTGNVVEA